MRVAFFAILVSPFLAFGQASSLNAFDTTGIQFENNLSWKEIQLKARNENKYIFLDCYATWCGPCKLMEKYIFSKKDVGDYFNTRFISVRVQMNKTSNDDQQIRNWYADANFIKIKYNIQSYPSYLFFSADGNIVHEEIGSTENSALFIAKASNALDPNSQYYKLIGNENDFKNDSVKLFHLLQTALAIKDKEHIVKLGRDYLKVVTNLFTKENLRIALELIRLDGSYTKEGEDFFVNNAPRINSVMEDNNFTEKVIGPRIFAREINSLFVKGVTPINWRIVSQDLQQRFSILDHLFMIILEDYFRSDVRKEVKDFLASQKDPIKDWNQISYELQKRFPDYDSLEKIILKEEAAYCIEKKRWQESERFSYLLLRKYSNQMRDKEVNGIIWEFLFFYSNDRKILRDAIKLMDRIIKKEDRENLASYMDTYANLLYKIGKKEKAIFWENKAIEHANKFNHQGLNEYNAALGKMKKGSPTWRTDLIM